MAQTMISFRIEEELKKSMESICQELGLSMTTAFTIFAKQMVREQKIPFEVAIPKKKESSMTIDEQLTTVVDDLVNEFGSNYDISRANLLEIMKQRFQTPPGSVIPSDYCYNRINNGITLSKPTLFKFLGRGQYRCLGTQYYYNGPIYHRPKGSKTDIIVGQCIDGERILDETFLNENSWR